MASSNAVFEKEIISRLNIKSVAHIFKWPIGFVCLATCKKKSVLNVTWEQLCNKPLGRDRWQGSLV